MSSSGIPRPAGEREGKGRVALGEVIMADDDRQSGDEDWASEAPGDVVIGDRECEVVVGDDVVVGDGERETVGNNVVIYDQERETVAVGDDDDVVIDDSARATSEVAYVNDDVVFVGESEEEDETDDDDVLGDDDDGDEASEVPDDYGEIDEVDEASESLDCVDQALSALIMSEVGVAVSVAIGPIESFNGAREAVTALLGAVDDDDEVVHERVAAIARFAGDQLLIDDCNVLVVLDSCDLMGKALAAAASLPEYAAVPIDTLALMIAPIVKLVGDEREDVAALAQSTCAAILSHVQSECGDDSPLIEVLIANFREPSASDVVRVACIDWIASCICSAPYARRSQGMWANLASTLPASSAGESPAVLRACRNLFIHLFTQRPSMFSLSVRAMPQDDQRGILEHLPHVTPSITNPFSRSALTLLEHSLRLNAIGLSPTSFLRATPSASVTPSTTNIDQLLDAATTSSSVPSCTWLLEQFLDLRSPRFTPKMLNFLCHDVAVCVAFVRFLTRAGAPDVSDPNTHRAMRRSYQVLRMLTRTGPNNDALSKQQGVRIIAQVLAEGFGPGSSNLYHVSSLLCHFISDHPAIVCAALLPSSAEAATVATSSIVTMIGLICEPAIPQVIVALSSMPKLFPLFADLRLVDRLLAAAMTPESSEAASDLLAVLFDRWALVPDAEPLLREPFVARICAAPLSRPVVRILSAIVRLAIFNLRLSDSSPCPPPSRPVAVDFLSDAPEFRPPPSSAPLTTPEWQQTIRSIWAEVKASLPQLCSTLVNDAAWGGLPTFNTERLELLACIVDALDICTVDQIHSAIPNSCWPVIWQWSSSCRVNPMVLVKLHRLWSRIFADAVLLTRTLLHSPPATDTLLTSIVDTCLATPDSTRTSAMLSLFELLLEHGEQGRLLDATTVFLTSDPRSVTITERLCKRRLAYATIPLPPKPMGGERVFIT